MKYMIGLMISVAAATGWAQTAPTTMSEADIKGFTAFKANVYPILREQCVECHSHGPGPDHSSDDPQVSYQKVLTYVNFQNLKYSKFVTKGTNGHGNGYGAKKPVTLTQDELIKALQNWWDQGQNQVFFQGKKVLPSQDIPVIPQNGAATMTWSMDDLVDGNTTNSAGADLKNIKFQVDVERFMEASADHAGAYRLKNPRFITNGKSVKVEGVHITMNGQYDGLANDYSMVSGVVNSTSGAVVSSSMQIVLDAKGPKQDKLGFAFTKIELSSEKSTVLAQAQEAQVQNLSLKNAQDVNIKSIDSSRAIDVFNPSVVGDKAYKFVKISKGNFEVGSPESDPNHYSYGTHTSERLHKVCLSKDFEMQATDVTQLQWYLAMGTTPSNFKNESNCDKDNFVKTKNGDSICKNHPVEQVSWEDIQRFLKRLNEIQSEYTYSLPTESQWEYVTRDGLPVEYSYGWGSDFDGAYAWYGSNSDNRTHEVGTRAPLLIGQNQQPIWDLNGNVWQWMSDYYDESYGLTDAQLTGDKCVVDPHGAKAGSYRVLRGGSWINVPQFLRSAFRYFNVPGFRYDDFGFRLVRAKR